MIRAGYVFLEPASVTLLGYGVDELDQHRDRDFLRSLKRRLGSVTITLNAYRPF